MYGKQLPSLILFPIECFLQRRRMELEDKAKVAASVRGTEFVQFLAALAV